MGSAWSTVFRGPGDKHFSLEEKRRLASLEPFFVHALKDGANAPTSLADSGEIGIIVADRDGRLKYLSDAGRPLLYRALYPTLSARSVRPDLTALPPALRDLSRNVFRAVGDGSVGTPPVHDVRNPLGRFIFRAHLLDEAAGLAGILVTHEQPLAIKLVRRIGELPVTGRQGEVCLHVANGESNETMAERMGITKNTAIAHRRWLYDRLNVHNRSSSWQHSWEAARAAEPGDGIRRSIMISLRQTRLFQIDR